MAFIENIKKFFSRISGKDNPHYLSRAEAKRIERENKETVSRLEKAKRRKNVSESEYLTEMRNPANIIEFDNLCTYFFTESGVVKAVDGVSFDIPKNTVVGVVGESGCGKSVTSLSLMQLVQAPQGQIVSGSIRYAAEDKTYDIAKMPTDVMNKVRGAQISMIFQEPMTSLNPVLTVGNQLDEVTLLHVPGATKESAKQRSIEMLKAVEIPIPENIYSRYPHELSGGMRQRVMIAMAIACNPRLIIADEPTTALDVTIQAQILDLLRSVKEKINGSIMLITHDLGVVAEMADYVVVMYAGRVIEQGTTEEIFDRPLHPYTVGLQKSKPAINKKIERLSTIPGNVPSPVNMPQHCYFKERCGRCTEQCSGEYPPYIQLSKTRGVACYLYKDGVEAAQSAESAETVNAGAALSSAEISVPSVPEQSETGTESEQAVLNAEPATASEPASVNPADTQTENTQAESTQAGTDSAAPSPKKTATKPAAAKTTAAKTKTGTSSTATAPKQTAAKPTTAKTTAAKTKTGTSSTATAPKQAAAKPSAAKTTAAKAKTGTTSAATAPKPAATKPATKTAAAKAKAAAETIGNKDGENQ